MSKPNQYIGQAQADALLRADAAMKAAGLGGLQINSAYRSYAEQERLYNQLKGKQAVAPPGKSAHNVGTDVDIQNYAAAKPFLEAEGFKWSNYRNDPWHFQWTGGGSKPVVPKSGTTQQVQEPAQAIQPAIDYNKDISGLGSINEMYSSLGMQPFEQPQSITIEPVKPTVTKEPTTDKEWEQFFNKSIDYAKNWKPPEQPKPQEPQKNVFEQFGAGVANPFTGFRGDVTKQQYGQGLPYMAGEFVGSLGANIAGFGGGALVGGPIGAGVGGFGAGAALGALANEQRRRLSGQAPDLGQSAMVGAIEGGLNLIPGVGSELSALRRVGVNAALQGVAGGAGVAATQALTGEQITPQSVGMGALLGAAGGAAGGLADTRILPKREPSLAPRGQAVRAGVTDFVPIQKRVQVTTPAIGQQLTDTPTGRPVNIGPSGVEIKPQQVVDGATQMTLFPEFAVPDKPVIKTDIEYTPRVNRPIDNAVATTVLDLTPEQQQALAALEESYLRKKQQVKEGSYIGSGSVYEVADKALGHEYARAKREIIQGDKLHLVDGGLTESELAAVRKREMDVNYSGKQVKVAFTRDNGATSIVNGTVIDTAYGKVGVKLDTGETLRVPKKDVTPAREIPPFRIEEPKAPVEPQPAQPQITNTVDSILYDVATDPTDATAMQAAREALPGYGDENIRALADDVRMVADDAIGRNEPIPDNITQKRVAPKQDPADAVMDVAPKPENPDQIIMKSRQLKGSRDEMIAQGTEGTIVRTKADYDALVKHNQELKTITLAKNRASLVDDLPNEAVVQRAEEILTTTDVNGFAVPDSARKRITNLWAKVQDGSATERTFTALRKEIVDTDLRTEKMRVQQQLNELHPNVREAFSHNFDPETGLATQKNLSGSKSLDEIKDALTPEQYNAAKDWENAAKADAQIRIDADTNITGATSRVAERTVTPLGFRMDKDGHVAGLAYNEDGHFASYYFTKKPAVDGQISTINSVGEMVNTSGYRGSYANMYQGVREFSVDSILKRPPRLDEGIRTSEALQIAERAGSLLGRTDLIAENPKLGKILMDLEKNPRAATVETIKDMETLLNTEPKLLKKLCQILGKVG